MLKLLSNFKQLNLHVSIHASLILLIPILINIFFKISRSLTIKANGVEFKRLTNKITSLELTVSDEFNNEKVLRYRN